MTEAQIQLQNALTTTFLANLAFLSEYDNDLYHRVDELSRIIEDGTYEEKYVLEFIMENGDFDIYDVKNNKYLYNKIPKRINDQLVRKIEFNQKQSILNIEEYFNIKQPNNIDSEDRFKYENSSDFSYLTINDIFEYTYCLKDFLDKKKQLKTIKKFMFLGTLLGRHIPRIAEKIDAEMYLVCERNLEIFRLSLFTVDYTILAQKGVIFSIMDGPLKELEEIKKFVDIGYLDNNILKFSTTNVNIEDYVDSILSYLVSNKPTMYDYNRYLYIKVNRTTKMLKSDYRTLLFNQVEEKCNFFNNIPILYLAAGPSLEENIEWIKENQNNFFIVTIGAAYKKLIKNDIKIDMITSLDEDSILNDIQFDDESVSKVATNTIFIINCATNPQIIEKLKNRNLFLYETQVPMHKKNIAFNGFSIGEVTLDILLKMNPKEIYLIGLDLALNQDTGLSHSKDSNSALKSYDLNEIYNREFFSLNKGVIKVKGNLKEDVKTTSIFYNSIQSANSKLEQKKDDCNIYNLSLHGAYLKNTIPKEILKVDISKYKILNLKNDLFNTFLKENSLNKLSKDSIKEVIKEIEFLNKIMEKDLRKFKDSDFETYEEFKNIFLDILQSIQEYKFSFIFQIVNDYSKIIFPYLTYHFNDVKVKNEEKKVKKLKEILVRQIEKNLKDYIICLERLSK